jgi:RNA polymerase sigma factor (sigma-70 family)
VHTASIPAQVPLGPLRSKHLLALATDGTLVEQIRRGNEAAFSVAFERHAAGLLSFCRHMVGSPEEAEDVVQHTFAAAFRDLARPSEREVALKPWLYAIARNRCLSLLRARREQTALDFDLPTEGLTAQVERRAELRDVLRDLRELPDDQRAALLLAEAGGLTHTEVAGVLGCEVANVKALVFRARSGLIKRREARETACADIREQLANLRGSSLRRNGLRHHLRSCAGCRAYREQVKHQRRLLAAALPVVPSLDLRSSLLAAAGLGSGSAGGGLAAGVGAGLSASLGAGTLVKIAAVGVLAGGGVATGMAFLGDADRPSAPSPQAAAAPASSGADFRSPIETERPLKSGVQRSKPPVVDPATGPGAPGQRSGAAPPAPGRPDGQRSPGLDQGASAAPSVGAAPRSGQARGHDEPPGTVRPEPDRSGPTAAPPASAPVKGGRPTGQPPSAPAERGPPASAPIRHGPPSSAPDGRGPPPSAPAERTPPNSDPGQGGSPGPKPSPERRANPAAPESTPVAAPNPAPGLPPRWAPDPPEPAKGPET